MMQMLGIQVALMASFILQSAVTASGSDKKIVLTRSIALQRMTDFPSAEAF